MLIKTRTDIPASEITDPEVYRERRRFMQGIAGLSLAGALGGYMTPAQAGYGGKALHFTPVQKYRVNDKLTPYKDVTTYNNFYELGISKSDPARLANTMKPSPWSVVVEGECAKPGRYDLEDILKRHPLEERIYRFRCVEGWSMVIPWVGFPLASLLKHFEPNSNAKFVEFETLYDPVQFPNERSRVLDWPYTEGLRMDEAMHPLAIMVVGLYGEVLPNQNGAPMRLMVPWKYGFKNIKSIAKIRFIEGMPDSTWMKESPREYGFYSNVNPHVDHPRWSQKTERRIGEWGRRPTLMFNGYADQVAYLYKGMDLKKYF